MSDEYCFAEHCRYRHWQSGSMPTHRRGDSCPKEHTPTTEEVRDAFATRKWDNFQRNYPNSHDKTERDAERERFDRWRDQVKAEALREYAAALEEVPDYAPSEYDQGRVDQRHMIITELLERAHRIEAASD